MIDRVARTTTVAARAGQPCGSGQVFTADVMRELAAAKPDRFEWDEKSGELRRVLNIVYEGNMIFIC